MIVSNVFCEITVEVREILKFLDTRYVVMPEYKVTGEDDSDFELVSYKLLSEYDGITQNQFKRELAQKRQDYELISVEPKSAGMASIAARDGRVDLVRVSPQSSLSIFNKRYARRLQENEKLVELDLSFFFEHQLAKNLRPLLRVLETFKNVDLKYSLTNLPRKPHLLRSYRGLQAIGRKLGLTNPQTKEQHLIERIERNGQKLDGKIPMPGVELVEW